MRNPLKQISSKTDNQWKCPIEGCNVTYENESNLCMHYKNVHKSYLKLAEPETPQRSNKQKVKFECFECPAWFRSLENLEMHRQKFHEDYKCDKCNATFKKLHAFTEHVKVKHEGLRYYCSYPGCRFKSTSKYYAVNHLRIVHFLSNEEWKSYSDMIMRK